MEECQRDMFGKLVRNPAGTRLKLIFMKTHAIDDVIPSYLERYEVDSNKYDENCRNMMEMPPNLRDLMKDHHQSELLL
jgi:hypothetical protein